MPLQQSSRLVSEIVTAVQRQFGDESGTQITSDDIIRWINQGQEAIAIAEKVKRTTVTTTSVANQGQYTLPGSNIIDIEAVFYANLPLDDITFEQAQASILSDVDATTIISIPTNWYEYGNSIYLYPTPVASGDTITLYVVLRPTAVVTTTDTLSIPDQYYNALLQYIMAQAYELDDEFDKSALKMQQMGSSLDELQSEATNRYYNVLTVLPEDQ